ncbi:MAG: hypothetical protein ABFC77_03030 [Thermoguttaceae bacterium]
MTTHNFTLVLSGLPEFTDEMAGALYAAGCDDAIVSTRGGIPCLEFDRDAESFSEAVLSAIQNVENCEVNGKPVGLRVQRMEPDDLVNASEIGRRAGITREYVRQLASGDRGTGGFPSPVCNCAGKNLWSWTAVSGWMKANNIAVETSSIDPRELMLINASLTARNCEPSPDEIRRISMTLFPKRRTKWQQLVRAFRMGRGATSR